MIFLRSLRHSLALLLFCALPSPELLAASPTLEFLYPAGGSQSSTQTVAVTGKMDPWPAQVWVSEPGITFVAETNKNRYTVTVAADATPGPRWVRLYNEEGVSEPMFFVVGAGHELSDLEPNNRPAQPQILSRLPVTINGRLDKNGDVDGFGIRLDAGEWLVAKLDAYVLMSKMDAMMKLVTTNGVQLAWNHDGGTLDPELQFRASQAGLYVLQIMGFPYPADSDVRLAGGDAYVYRLHLKTTGVPPESEGTQASQRETEPNNHPPSAPLIELPGRLHGTIQEPGDIDAFRWKASKDSTYAMEVFAGRQGSPLDAWLKVVDAEGKELVRVDDSEGTRDPKLEWKAPADGVYAVVVGNLLHQGGKKHRYRLTIQRSLPGFDGVLPASSLQMTAGQTHEFKVTVQRLRGQTNALTLSARGLPASVSASEVLVSEKGGETTLKLAADSQALAFSGPVRFVVKEAGTGTERTAVFSLTTRTENNGVPGGYQSLVRETIEDCWLTLRPKKP